MTASGCLVLVVGPSGAGKDSLIAGARAALADEPNFAFPRRVVTRHAVAALEDHHSLGREAFLAARLAGRYALDWEAHGLCYALPMEIETDLAAGRTVVANVSRRVVPVAVRRYPASVVVLVTAEMPLRASRLAARGRESADEVAARLSREGPALPSEIEAILVDNSAALADGVARFVAVLRSVQSRAP